MSAGIDALGWMGAVVALAGVYLISRKIRAGWWVSILANILLGAVQGYNQLWSQVILLGMFTLIDVQALLRD